MVVFAFLSPWLVSFWWVSSSLSWALSYLTWQSWPQFARVVIGGALDASSGSLLPNLAVLASIIWGVIITLLVTKLLSKTILKGRPASCTRELPPYIFFFQAEDGIRDLYVTGVQTCALPIFRSVLLPMLARSLSPRRDGRRTLRRSFRCCAPLLRRVIPWLRTL